MIACERQFENRVAVQFGEHLTCSLMLLRFLPMSSGSQQCLNVAQRWRPFTAITRVQILSGTPNRINKLSFLTPGFRDHPVATGDYMDEAAFATFRLDAGSTSSKPFFSSTGFRSPFTMRSCARRLSSIRACA